MSDHRRSSSISDVQSAQCSVLHMIANRLVDAASMEEAVETLPAQAEQLSRVAARLRFIVDELREVEGVLDHVLTDIRTEDKVRRKQIGDSPVG